MKNNNVIKEKLNNYAINSAWNNFVDNGGKVDDYNRFKAIKKDLETENNEEKDLKNN